MHYVQYDSKFLCARRIWHDECFPLRTKIAQSESAGSCNQMAEDRIMSTRLIVLLVTAFTTAQVASAITLPVNDTLSGADEITTLGSSSPWSDIIFIYEVASLDDAIFKYTYTWEDPDASKDLSHIIIQLSNDPTAWYKFETPSCLSQPEIGTWTSNNGNSNPGMPGDVYGVKFDLTEDVSSVTFSIITDRVPAWGDFYVEDGRANKDDFAAAWNAGFGNEPFRDYEDGDVFPNKILRPDSRPAGSVPDGGASAALLGLGLVGLATLARQKS